MTRGGFEECAGGCACRCHKIAAGRRQGNRRRAKDEWSKDEIDLLRKHVADGSTVETIVKALYGTLTSTRSRAAVRSKCRALGLLYHQGWYSGAEIRAAFGVSSRRIEKWREQGLLPARRHVNIQRDSATGRRWWHYREVDVLAFIDGQAGVAFNPFVMAPGAWRNRAQVAAVSNTLRKARTAS